MGPGTKSDGLSQHSCSGVQIPTGNDLRFTKHHRKEMQEVREHLQVSGDEELGNSLETQKALYILYYVRSML